MTGSGNDSVTRRVVVGNCSTSLGYSCAVVEAALVVQRNGAVVLEVECFCPVIRKNLGSRKIISTERPWQNGYETTHSQGSRRFQRQNVSQT